MTLSKDAKISFPQAAGGLSHHFPLSGLLSGQKVIPRSIITAIMAAAASLVIRLFMTVLKIFGWIKTGLVLLDCSCAISISRQIRSRVRGLALTCSPCFMDSFVLFLDLILSPLRLDST